MNTVSKIEPSGSSFGFNTYHVTGFCDGAPFDVEHLAEPLPGGGLTEADTLNLIRMERQRLAYVHRDSAQQP